MILSIAGFGRTMTWSSDTDIPQGHRMDFTQAIYTVTTDVIIRVVTPAFVSKISKKVKQVYTAFEELGVRTVNLMTDVILMFP